MTDLRNIYSKDTDESILIAEILDITKKMKKLANSESWDELEVLSKERHSMIEAISPKISDSLLLRKMSSDIMAQDEIIKATIEQKKLSFIQSFVQIKKGMNANKIYANIEKDTL